MPLSKESYLGDGVYIAFDGYSLKLWTDRDYVEHYIYLEPVVYEALLKYVERLRLTPTGKMPE